MKKILILLLFILTLQMGFGQQVFPFEYIKKLDYFDAYTELRSKQDVYKDDKYENQYWQAMGTIYCFLGREDKAIQCFHTRDSIENRTRDVQSQFNSALNMPFDNLFYLVDNYNVVMLNEAHHVSSDRAMLYYLLPILKEKGFSQLALEALNNAEYEDTLLQKREYPIYTKTGIYINDPVYACVIRRALELGYKLIPYESYQTDRERNEANNLINKYDPTKGKLIVYAGYAHISKSPERQLMGYHFKSSLKEDYLSLSQCIPNNYSYQTGMDKGYYQLMPDSSKFYDFFVLPPNKIDSLNIPGWYSILNFNYARLSDYYNATFDFPALIQVYNKDEVDGIPVYQYLIEDYSERDILLAFPEAGEYKLKIINKKQRFEKDIKLHKNNTKS